MDLEIKDKTWVEFYLKDIFNEVQRGKRLKKDDHKKGNIPYVSSTASNNGVDGFIGNTENVRMFENCLTIANSGSVGATFFQSFPFIASDHITKLENTNFNKYIYLFIATVTKRLDEKYSFNREINDSRLQKEKILLPANDEGQPDYAFMEMYMKRLEEEKIKKYLNYTNLKISGLNKKLGGGVKPLNEKEWEEFEIRKIFIVKSGTRLTKSDMKKGNTPFVGATDSNNGITEFISNKNASSDSNVLGVNYNGSVVENFYHPYTAIFSDDVKRLSFREVEGNKYLFLFVKNQILKQKDKYQYGYKFNGARMNKQKITLPVNSKKEPDYEFMENYIKKIEFEKLNKYINKING